jgi:hypothetical protein
LFFFIDPWGTRRINSKITFEEFATLMKDSNYETGKVPFDNIFTANNGFVARQLGGNDPYRQLLTWKYSRDCTCEVTVPLSSTWVGLDDFPDFLKGYDHALSLVELCFEIGLSRGKLLDLSQSYFILSSLMIRLYRLYQIEGLKWPVYVKIRISGTWRTIPFLDLQEYVSFISNHGVPLVQQQECFVPPGMNPDDCIELYEETSLQGEIADLDERASVARMVDACRILLSVAEALGLHHSAAGFDPNCTEDNGWLTKMCAMGDRAINVSKQRSLLLRAQKGHPF